MTDPQVTTFLTMWAYEDYWHGEALAAVSTALPGLAGLNLVSRAATGYGIG